MDVRLPIDVVPNTAPPKFKWRQVVSTFDGAQEIEHEGTLPPSVETAVADLISLTKRLTVENARLRGK